jgi:bla regulator protein blaR1
MIVENVSALCAAIAPALENHIWQSTLFAIMAGLLTLSLRQNHARVRYWLWLAASVKFLVSFSLLTAIGNHLAWIRGSVGATGGFYFAMEEVGQPFTQSTMTAISKAAPSTASARLVHVFPALLAAAWLCGFVIVFVVWCARWRRISAAIGKAVPLREGREAETLRRLERMGGIRKPIEMFLSRASLEPGIFGIIRPVLLWPERISARLDGAHLEAILAHELRHVSRRDNLTSSLHMIVEAIFWFHPLVWWLGRRLLEERERACDEEVLELGGDRQVYAESILKVCEFCVGSPLACVSGVTGADLKKRMVYIMTERIAQKLDFGRKLLLSAAGFAAVALPIVIGLVNATPLRAQSSAGNAASVTPTFEAVTIKADESGRMVHNMVRVMFTPDGFTASNVTLAQVIQEAYGVGSNQISGAPDWLSSETFDVEANVDSSVAGQLRQLDDDKRRLAQQRMLQALLANRFNLSLHAESEVRTGYQMVIAPNGPKLRQSKPGDTYSDGFKTGGGEIVGGHRMLMGLGGGQVVSIGGQGVPLAGLAKQLSQQLGSTVVDKTGLNGNYDFNVQWTPESQTSGATSPGSSPSSLFTALQEQLGLELKSQTGPSQILIIDHVEKPADN